MTRKDQKKTLQVEMANKQNAASIQSCLGEKSDGEWNENEFQLEGAARHIAIGDDFSENAILWRKGLY